MNKWLVRRLVLQNQSSLIALMWMIIYMGAPFSSFLDMKHVRIHSNYLGLPMMVGNNRSNLYKNIEEKMGKRVHDWNNRMLSSVGRQIMVKSCFQSIPLYSMGCFRFPKKSCINMAKLGINFWWNGNSKHRSIHLVRKEIIMKDKSQGGLGFRCFESINIAMLMKHLWRVLTVPDLLISKFLKQKYFRNVSLTDCKPRSTDSYAWRSIIGAMNVFKVGIDVSTDNQWRWKFTDDRVYSVKSGYAFARRWILATQFHIGEASDWVQNSQVWDRFWKIRAPDRIKLLTWRLFYDSLPVYSNLRMRGCDSGKGCVFCSFKDENSNHLFFNRW